MSYTTFYTGNLYIYWKKKYVKNEMAELRGYWKNYNGCSRLSLSFDICLKKYYYIIFNLYICERNREIDTTMQLLYMYNHYQVLTMEKGLIFGALRWQKYLKIILIKLSDELQNKVNGVKKSRFWTLSEKGVWKWNLKSWAVPKIPWMLNR